MRIEELLPTLSPAVASHTLGSLRSALPAPEPDTPERRAVRDSLAIATVAAMRPMDAAQAMLAVQAVLHDAHAMECLRVSSEPGMDVRAILRHRAQAAKLMRGADQSRRTLLDIQAMRPISQPARQPPTPQETLRFVAAVTNQVTDREAEARRQRAARIRALDLRVIEIPPTIH
jgi:hypothetical protein